MKDQMDKNEKDKRISRPVWMSIHISLFIPSKSAIWAAFRQPSYPPPLLMKSITMPLIVLRKKMQMPQCRRGHFS